MVKPKSHQRKQPTRASIRLATQLSTIPPKLPKPPKKPRRLDGKYQRTAAEHFQELNDIWVLDRRIPTSKSRRAWCLARGLNPEVVNAWWYRRRTIAKKFGIQIPEGTYDLPIGNPPIIKVECEDDMMLIKEEPGDMVDIPGLLGKTTAYMHRIKQSRSSSPDDTLWDDGIPSSDGFSVDVYSSDTMAPSDGYDSSPPPEDDAYSHRNMPPPPVPYYARPPEDIAAKIGPLTLDSDWIRRCRRRSMQRKDLGPPFCNLGRTTVEAEKESFTCLLCLKSPLPKDEKCFYLPETWYLTQEYAALLPQYPPEHPNCCEDITLPIKKEDLPFVSLSALPFLSRSPDLRVPSEGMSDGLLAWSARAGRTVAPYSGILDEDSLVVEDAYVSYELEGERMDFLPSKERL